MGDNKLRTAAVLLAGARQVVCLTGAGVSAESGIATFRDAQTGLWSRYDPMQLASPEGFAENPGLVWRWYMARLATLEAVTPNAGHVALAELADRVTHLTLVTQNVDDLHERAGSRNVLHLHGSISRFRCHRCAAPHTLTDADRAALEPPSCRVCGGPVRPAVVWFGEMLPTAAILTAQEAAASCDVMLVVGTSGIVFPAADLPWMARRAGAALIDINPSPTPFSDAAAVFLRGPSGVMLPQLLASMAAQH
jgi:NAD-dependent deacetylase